MRIAEASQQTGIPARLLRYYEEQDLIHPARTTSGYRDYSADDILTAQRIRQLLDAGLSSATIRNVLPCLVDLQDQLTPICPEVLAALRAEQDRITSAIEALTTSRDAIERVIAAGVTGSAS